MLVMLMRGSENSVMGGGPALSTYFFHQRISQDPSRSNWTSGSNCFPRGCVPEFLKKLIATFDFPGWRGGGGSGPPVLPLDPSMVLKKIFSWILVAHLSTSCGFL